MVEVSVDQILSHQPLLTVRHDADIPRESIQNGAITKVTHHSFLPIVRILVPDGKVESFRSSLYLVNRKHIFSECNQPFLLHHTQFMGQGTSVHT